MTDDFQTHSPHDTGYAGRAGAFGGKHGIWRLLVLVSTISTGIAAFWLGMPWPWVALFVGTAVAANLWLPALLRRRIASLDRALQEQMQRRQLDRLLPTYRRALLARLFAPRADMHVRLGQIHLELGDAAAARELLDRAVTECERADVPRLVAPLLRARFLTGDDPGTLKAFAVLNRQGLPLPVHAFGAAWAMTATGSAAGTVETFLARHLGSKGAGDVALAGLIHARLALRSKKLDRAAERLAAVDEARLPRELRPGWAFTRAELLAAQGEDRQARRLLERLAKEQAATRFGRDAARMLKELGAEPA